MQITKSPNHDHFFIQNGCLCERYRTMRGLRFREILNVDYDDMDNVDDGIIYDINQELANEKTR